MKKILIIDNDNRDLRIDKWLKINFSSLSQSFIEKNLRNGKMKLNKKKVKSYTKVKSGDQIDFFNFLFKEIIHQRTYRVYWLLEGVNGA